MKSVQPPLSNLQLELLKVFSKKLSEKDLLEVKELLAGFFARKAMDEADAAWDSKKYASMEEQLLKDHERTPYKPSDK
jgi:hypothetical protein